MRNSSSSFASAPSRSKGNAVLDERRDRAPSFQRRVFVSARIALQEGRMRNALLTSISRKKHTPYACALRQPLKSVSTFQNMESSCRDTCAPYTIESSRRDRAIRRLGKYDSAFQPVPRDAYLNLMRALSDDRGSIRLRTSTIYGALESAR